MLSGRPPSTPPGGQRQRKWPARSAIRRALGVQVQLIHETDLSAEEYVSTQAWRGAKLERCPRHPGGGCRFGRHGTYGRKYPDGMRIARHYCRDTPETFSMLPQFMAAGVAGTLDTIEEGAAAVESEAGLAAAAERMRPARRCHPRAARRWIRRRDTWVSALLTIVIGLFPGQFAGTPVRISAFREHAGTGSALTALRLLCVSHLQSLPAPVGFRRGGALAGSQTGPPTHDGPCRGRRHGPNRL